jgi:hypothetical protein
MEDEESYLKENIKELLEECNDVELLYLVKGLLLKETVNN